MLHPRQALERFRENGLEFFTGVPDSLLADFCGYVADETSPDEHIIAANEGAAVALAIGHFLGSGKPALVYMQNSGIGNAVNPLLSLADPEVYGIPMLLMIGWRGERGVKDEPQHVKQGAVMEPFMAAMDVPFYVLGKSDDGQAIIDEACARMRRETRPVAILVRKGAFESYAWRSRDESVQPLSREEAIQCVVERLDASDIVVSTTGKASRELYEYRVATGEGHARDFLTVGGMGHAASIAMGMALQQRNRRIVCLDGDGAVLMHMGSLAVIGQSAPANFLHIVLNNGVHDSVGGQPTVGLAIDLVKIAGACGYRSARSVSTREEIEEALGGLAQLEAGPALIEIRVRPGARDNLGRPATTPRENRDALMGHLGARVEGR